MAICATPGCGTPGRPFPACSLCNGKRYCGSHCLTELTEALREELLNDSSRTEELTEQLKKLSLGGRICPECLQRLKSF